MVELGARGPPGEGATWESRPPGGEEVMNMMKKTLHSNLVDILHIICIYIYIYLLIMFILQVAGFYIIRSDDDWSFEPGSLRTVDK